jgi:hypothetical protein
MTTKDKQRIDFLEATGGVTLHEPLAMPNTVGESSSWLIVDKFGDEIGSGKTLRAAIDAAKVKDREQA